MARTRVENEKRRAAANDKVASYVATVESMEPDISPIDASAFHASAAISLKRIADLLERLVELKGG